MGKRNRRSILLTGGSGTLGQSIINSTLFENLKAPDIKELNITNSQSIDDYLNSNEIDAVIHCAALARMSECEKNPISAIETNIIGTSNLVISVLKTALEKNKVIRFVYISTDGVYEGTKGNYSERDATIPYNRYGWTKLGGECAVNLLKDYCIIRTRFFNPSNLEFDGSPSDLFTSKVPIDYLVKAIYTMLWNKFVGTINIGGPRKSEYEVNRQFKNTIKPCKRKDILEILKFNLAKDASMNIDLWEKIKNF